LTCSYLLQLLISMAKLTREDVLKLARLARLDLSDDEIKEFSEELSAILQYVEQLQSVDVKGLKPTNQVTGLTNVWREDKEKNYGYEPAELLKNVPSKEDNQLKVKRMIG
jgi:aspartyl-tRNA(Asn)/glutamyl-tRNA(Gln) amidotransferase subunit C